MNALTHSSGWILLALVSLVGHTRADTDTSFGVTASIVAGCQITGVNVASSTDAGLVGVLNFGTFSSLSTETATSSLIADGAFTLSCTPGLDVTMSVNGGVNFSGSRQMQHDTESDLLEYTLFSDAALTQNITVDTPVNLDTNTDPDDIPLLIFGQLNLPGNTSPGAYSDTLTVTLEW